MVSIRWKVLINDLYCEQFLTRMNSIDFFSSFPELFFNRSSQRAASTCVTTATPTPIISTATPPAMDTSNPPALRRESVLTRTSSQSSVRREDRKTDGGNLLSLKILQVIIVTSSGAMNKGLAKYWTLDFCILQNILRFLIITKGPNPKASKKVNICRY